MTDDTIDLIVAREVLDSRGRPTVEVDVVCRGGARGRAIVPSGASTGRHEALELRDGDPARYAGRGVRQAVANVREVIAPALAGTLAGAQQHIDLTMIKLDGTADKSRLGANAILGVSLACAHAAAAARGLALWQYLDRGGEARLPLPMVNLISGGLHAGRNLDFQDFLFLPIAARSYAEALEQTTAVYRALGAVLTEHGYEGVLVGDEGGYGPKLSSNEQAIELILQAFQRAELQPGRDAALAIDVASTHFHRDGFYRVGELRLPAPEMVRLLSEWVDDYPIQSIEDGMAEDDWDGWQLLSQSLGRQVQLIGDDLFATNADRLAQGIAWKTANSVLVKVNQTRAAGYRPVISARSGETEDTTIADLAVGTGAGQIKIGSVARSERLAKYNQLLRIEEQMGGEQAPFARWVKV
jgi:enolase